MTADAFTHMETAWKLDRNPFPADAVRPLSGRSPYSSDIYPEEAQDFRQKFLRAMLMGSLRIGFLWSMGQRHDTGYGKTTLMQAIRNEVNADLGRVTLEAAGVRPERVKPIAAAMAALNTLSATGMYPVLFQAVVDLTVPATPDSPAVFDAARARIVASLGSDEEGRITSAVKEAWRAIAPGGAPLRTELLDAFAHSGAAGVGAALSSVSDATRLRAGIQFLDFAIAALATAEIEMLVVLIDQLEDLATNKAVSSSKRSKEIGRIRDLLEQAPYAQRLALVFTFHSTAARVLERFWETNRLPQFEPLPENASAVVSLTGLQDDERAAKLLAVYLEPARLETIEDDISPFEPAAVNALRRAAEDRPGVFLALAHRLLDQAARANADRIDGDFARRFLGGQVGEEDVLGEDEAAEFDVDDLLLG